MLKKIKIRYFKTVWDQEISLGAVNAFIGANGSGKSNILEAMLTFVEIVGDGASWGRSVEFRANGDMSPIFADRPMFLIWTSRRF